MTTDETETNQTLRQRAEKKLQPGAASHPQPLSLGEANLLLHELQVHQIELEMQNEELRRAQTELLAAKERYFDLYDLAPVSYLTISGKGLILEANLTAATMLGTSRGALLNQPLSNFILHEDADSYYLHRKEVLASEGPQTVELRVVKVDGAIFWAHLRTMVAKDGECRVVLTDISEHKRAAAESKRNEGRLKRLVDILQHPAETSKEFLDYALEQALQLTGSKIGYIYHYHEDRREFVLNSWSEGVMAACAVEQPLTCYELDKTGIWGEAVRQRRAIVVNDFQTANPLRKGYPAGHVQLVKFMTVPIFKGDHIVGVVGVANKEADYDEMDVLQVSLLLEVVWQVTDRLLAEEDLLSLSRHHKLILDSVEEGILGLDSQGRHTFINPAAAKMLGCKIEEMIGGPSHSVWHHSKADGSPYPEAECSINRAFQDGMEYRRASEVFWRPDGTSFPVEYVSTPIYERGRPVGAVLTFRDITGRRLAEDERANLQVHLNQAQKMEAIGVLAGGIAHDFNNILAVILGYTELARNEAAPGSGCAKDLDKVFTAAQRAKDLVRQILAFSRQTTVARLPMIIQPLIKESLKMLRSSLPSTILIKQDIQQQCGVVLADPTQVHQIVMNLCTNAFHAMEKTGGTLSVGLHPTVLAEPTLCNGQTLNPGVYLELTIGDTGSGIGPDIIGKIFDPFFTTKEIGQGTGMGLAITHGIINGYGGAITVESTLGQGATFHVYFPVIDDDEEEEVGAEDLVPASGRGRILFVDDEESLAEMGKVMLEKLGYTVTAHSRSIEALAAFMDEPDLFDLVITDQTMPALTGVELARRLLQIRPELPIILCTGFSSLVDADSAKAIGIKEFVFKPLLAAGLGKLVHKLLDEVKSCQCA